MYKPISLMKRWRCHIYGSHHNNPCWGVKLGRQLLKFFCSLSLFQIVIHLILFPLDSLFFKLQPLFLFSLFEFFVFDLILKYLFNILIHLSCQSWFIFSCCLTLTINWSVEFWFYKDLQIVLPRFKIPLQKFRPSLHNFWTFLYNSIFNYESY